VAGITRTTYPGRNVIIHAESHAEDLVNKASECDIDLFIVVLNNIIFREVARALHIDKALDLITQFKTSYQKPVIALTSWPPDDPTFAGKAARAGADFFLRLPCNLMDLEEAARRCLKG
jgi:DNA-binding NarL/FixJ family response regulator